VSKAAYRYPPDEFDAPPDPDAPRGVHRAPRSAWSRWWPFLAIIVVVPLVAWGAVTVLAQGGHLPDLGAGGSQTQDAGTGPTDAATTQPTGTATATTPAATPTTHAAQQAVLTTPVSVLNGSKINGLAGQVASKLTAAGFTNVTTGNTTAATPVASTVFYGSDALKATAELVGQTIHVSNVVMSPTDAPNGIVVVLRSNPSA
jgi:hypothetical protein